MKVISTVQAVIPDNRITITKAGCWQWTGALCSEGYAIVNISGKRQFVHRLMFQAFVGFISYNQEIDHLCRNRACVNPAHLETVSSYENSRRGNHPLFVAHRNHTCLRGHDLSDESNIYRRQKDGRPRCRQCRRIALQEWRARQKTEQAACVR